MAETSKLKSKGAKSPVIPMRKARTRSKANLSKEEMLIRRNKGNKRHSTQRWLSFS